jgi:hypothetical protein
MHGRRANSACWLGRVLLLILLAGLPLAAACGNEGSGTSAADPGPGGDNDVSPPEEGEADSQSVPAAPPPGNSEAQSDPGPSGANAGPTPEEIEEMEEAEAPPTAGEGEAGVLDGPSEDSTSIPDYGAEDGYIWTPYCEVYVWERLDAGLYAELRQELDECVLSDPSTPPDVVDAALDADAVAEERLAGAG